MSKPINVTSVDTRSGSTYPTQFRSEVEARSKRVLGDLFGLTNYGVNLVELQPGAWSAQRHWHTEEDEFVYVVAGELTLVTDDGEQFNGFFQYRDIKFVLRQWPVDNEDIRSERRYGERNINHTLLQTLFDLFLHVNGPLPIQTCRAANPPAN